MVIRWLGAACAAWMCLGCGGSSKSPDGGAARPVVVSEAARVSDPDTRAALSAYDRDAGTLRFSRSTALLAALKLDDVLVSEPSTAAPSGFLRKVKSVRSEGSEVVLETTQANLTDVITQGDLSAGAELGLDDLPHVETLAPGVTVHRAALGTIGVGDGYQFGLNFDQTILDIDEVSDDGDERVRAKIRIDGDIDFNAGYGIEVHIDPPNVNPLDSDFDLLPSLARFEASIGFSQRARLHVTGDADAEVTKEKKVAEVPFSPKCFFIGPIPVCVVPTIYVFVGTHGQVRLSFDYGATETAQAKIGARWTKSNGWEKIDPTPGYDSFVGQTFDVNGGMNVQAWAKVEGSLKLYDAAGPTLGAKLGLSVDAQLKRNPFWTARATLEAYYGFIVDLPIVGRLSDGHDTLFSVSKEVARSSNRPPQIIVQRPSWLVDLGQPLSLGFFLSDNTCVGTVYCVVDQEDGVASYTLTSDRDGPLPSTSYTFATEGLRRLTVAARDSEGATSTASFTVDVVNTPPVVYGSAGTTTTPQTVPVFIAASASDPNSPVDCSALTWSAQAPDTVEPQNLSADACQARAVFNVKGTRHVTLQGRDPQGASSTPRVFTVEVTDPPANPPPTIVQPLSVKGANPIGFAVREIPENGQAYGPISFSLLATDPDGVTYIFTAQCFDCQNPALNIQQTFDQNTTGISSFLPPQTGTWRFGARATDGLSPGVSFSRTVVSVPTPPR